MGNRFVTKRVTVSELENCIDNPVKVLDHGFVRLVDYMGSDASVVQAARVSYGAGTKSVREDAGLIKYLVKNQHSSPVEMIELKFHMKLPLFVARQIIRHRAATYSSFNEYSARYSILNKEFYIPDPWVLGAQSQSNNQGTEILSKEYYSAYQDGVREEIDAHSEACYRLYQGFLNSDDDGNILVEGEPGLSRELSRMVLPLNIYTEWYWKIDMHNLLHFLWLRIDEHAQWETRQYANVIGNIVSKGYPMVWEAFCNYELNSVKLSMNQVSALIKVIREIKGVPEELYDKIVKGLPRRDKAELWRLLSVAVVEDDVNLQ